MLRRTAIATFALAALSLAACTRYVGDGRFVDNGWLNYSRRYVVELGSIDLSRPTTQQFRLAGLPRAEFHVGLELEEPPDLRVSGSEPTHEVIVRVEMFTSGGELVIRKEARLGDWVRSFALDSPNSARLYRRGEAVERTISEGVTKSEKLGIKAHGGWGTSFRSARGADYRLSVTVVDSELPSALESKVILVGW